MKAYEWLRPAATLPEYPLPTTRCFTRLEIKWRVKAVSFRLMFSCNQNFDYLFIRLSLGQGMQSWSEKHVDKLQIR